MVWQITKTVWGGSGQYALRLRNALCAAGVECNLLVAEGSTQNGVSCLEPLQALWRKLATRVLIGLLNRSTTASFHTGYRFARWRPRTPIMPGDVVHLQGMTGWIGFSGLEAIIPKGARVFWTAHDLWMLSGGCVVYNGCENYAQGCRRCPILRKPVNRLSRFEFRRKAHFIRTRGVTPIANSRWTADRIRASAMFPALSDVFIVPPIVDAAYSGQTSEPNLREELGIAPGRSLIGLGARSLTDDSKGILQFLKQLEQFPKLASSVTVLLFGDGELATPHALDCRCLGPVADPSKLARVYRACDVFVSPSRMETFGMTLLEAQACGTPVVGFRVGGAAEAVYAGDTDNLVKINDFPAMLSLIAKLVTASQKQQRADSLASNWVWTHFSAATVGRVQREIYETSF